MNENSEKITFSDASIALNVSYRKISYTAEKLYGSTLPLAPLGRSGHPCFVLTREQLENIRTYIHSEEEAKKNGMSTKEIANALGVTERTIQATRKSLRETKNISFSVTKGKKAYHTAEETTAIKLDLQNRGKVNSLSPKTETEKDMIVQQAMLILQERTNALQIRCEQLENQIEAQKPALEYYSNVVETHDAIDIGTVGKQLTPPVGRNNLFALLREKHVLMQNNQPYQKYVDSGYFRVVQTSWTEPNGEVHLYNKTLVHPRGINFINGVVNGGEGKL